MSTLNRRLLRLEGPTVPPLPPIAVVSADIPTVTTAEWAADLMATYGWSDLHLTVFVQSGTPELLLAPTPYVWVRCDAERIWLGTLDHYPNAMILNGDGLAVQRFDHEADLRRWLRDAEKELAA